MPIKVSTDLWGLLPIVVAGLIIAGACLLTYTIGRATGETRGFERAPEELRRRLMDEQQKRLIAEGRLDAERRAGRQVASALAALTAQAEQEPGLRLAKGGRE